MSMSTQEFDLIIEDAAKLNHDLINLTPVRGALNELHSHYFIAHCSKCLHLVVIRRTLEPKPWIFGRDKWRPFKIDGLPSVYYCNFLRRVDANRSRFYR